jgi:hypothetical protein
MSRVTRSQLWWQNDRLNQETLKLSKITNFKMFFYFDYADHFVVIRDDLFCHMWLFVPRGRVLQSAYCADTREKRLRMRAYQNVFLEFKRVFLVWKEIQNMFTVYFCRTHILYLWRHYERISLKFKELTLSLVFCEDLRSSKW